MSLLNLLKTNKNARKIFGKKELDIIYRQLEGVSLKQSEKNRLSRDIRPKLDFIKDIAGFSEEFELKKNQNNRKLIDRAVEAILNDELGKDIKAILLFGSFADNSYTPMSDIDICVVFREISSSESTQFRIRVSGQLPDKVDVQVFNILPQKIKRDIARNHRVLYQSNDYDNTDFSIKYLKDDDYFIRMNKIFGAEA